MTLGGEIVDGPDGRENGQGRHHSERHRRDVPHSDQDRALGRARCRQLHHLLGDEYLRSQAIGAMTMKLRLSVLLMVWGLLHAGPAEVFAQLTAAKDGPVVYGHHHLNTRTWPPEETFVDTLGGVAITSGRTTRR